MNIELIKARIQEIENYIWDNETAHMLDDKLRNEFISFLAEGNNAQLTPAMEIKNMAELIKSINNLDFVRWYA